MRQHLMHCPAPHTPAPDLPPQASDVYSFGVLLWEMLSGRRPWAGLSQPAIVHKVAVLRASLEMPPCLPPALDALLRSCLSRAPNMRPSFEAAANVLEGWLAQQGAAAAAGAHAGGSASASAGRCGAAAAGGTSSSGGGISSRFKECLARLQCCRRVR